MHKSVPVKILIASMLYFASNIVASEHNIICKISPKILEAIAIVERHPKMGPGYPYIVSFNSPSDSKAIRSVIGDELFLDSRTIDCKNSELCQKVTKFIVSQNIENLDLGAYQFNYRHHKDRAPLAYYFSFDKSYIQACMYLEELIRTHGNSWETIGRYHSSTPKYNYAYLQKISEIFSEGQKK